MKTLETPTAYASAGQSRLDVEAMDITKDHTDMPTSARPCFTVESCCQCSADASWSGSGTSRPSRPGAGRSRSPTDVRGMRRRGGGRESTVARSAPSPRRSSGRPRWRVANRVAKPAEIGGRRRTPTGVDGRGVAQLRRGVPAPGSVGVRGSSPRPPRAPRSVPLGEWATPGPRFRTASGWVAGDSRGPSGFGGSARE